MLEMTSIVTKNNTLIISGSMRKGNNYLKEIIINQQIEDDFYNKFSELRVWDWVEDFDTFLQYERLPDGFSWKLEAEIKGKKVKSKGNGTFPKTYNKFVKFLDIICKTDNYQKIKYNNDTENFDIIDGY